MSDLYSRVRVKDPVSQHEFTTSADFAESAGLTVLKQDAVDPYGRDLPPVHHVADAKPAAKKES